MERAQLDKIIEKFDELFKKEDYKKVLNSLDYDQLVLLTNYLIGLNRDLNNRKGEDNE